MLLIVMTVKLAAVANCYYSVVWIIKLVEST